MEFQGEYHSKDWKDWERKKQFLLKFCMEAKWKKVVDMYDKYPSLQYAQLTELKETALHIAVSESLEDIVRKLVESIERSERWGTTSPLRMQNDRGNTPLHQAALIGNVGKCMCIAEKDEELVRFRNNTGETPLFLAALRGKKKAFLYLDQISYPENHRRWRDGDTTLHVAVTGEYFDLAYEIICKHDDQLIYAVNDQGYTPLHLLASKPLVFRTVGDQHGFIDRIIYHCLHVKKLFKVPRLEKDTEKYPRNYKTCINFFQTLLKMLLKMLQNMIRRPVTCGESSSTSQRHMQANDAANYFEDPEERHDDTRQNEGKRSSNIEAEERPQLFPPNYHTSIMIIKSIGRVILKCIGSIEIVRLQAKKEKNIWSVQIVDLMLHKCSHHNYDIIYSGRDPRLMQDLSDMYELKDREEGEFMVSTTSDKRRETPILLAAKNGITEMVLRILEVFPMAILDRDSVGKNIVLLAVENRRTKLYQQLVRKISFKESTFRVVDNKGNSALHLAATLGDYHQAYPLAALKMQWEINWYKYVKYSVSRDLSMGLNNDNMTPREVFKKSHKKLIKKGSKWLISTSNSCSVVATVVATVAFASTASVPGGMKEGSSRPNLERHPGFIVFAISSLIALSFSVTSVIAFLSILTPRRGRKYFRKDMPKTLLHALTYLFISLAAMLVCFCAGHFFLMRDNWEHNAFLVYGIACLPVVYFIMKRFPFYIDLLRDTFSNAPPYMPSA